MQAELGGNLRTHPKACSGIENEMERSLAVQHDWHEDAVIDPFEWHGAERGRWFDRLGLGCNDSRQHENQQCEFTSKVDGTPSDARRTP